MAKFLRKTPCAVPDRLPKKKQKSKKMEKSNIDDLVKSRHSRVGGNPGPTKPIEKTGFPFPRE
jgi:hypothetical protein